VVDWNLKVATALLEIMAKKIIQLAVVHKTAEEILSIPVAERPQRVTVSEARRAGMQVVDGVGGSAQFIGTKEGLAAYREEWKGATFSSSGRRWM